MRGEQSQQRWPALGQAKNNKEWRGAALVAEELEYRYPHAAAPVLEDIHLEAKSGQMLAILGNNGAGKSTLLNLLSGMQRPARGRVLVEGIDVATQNRREIARHVAYVAQQQRVPHLSVYDQVLLGRKPYITWGLSNNDRKTVSETIASLGLSPFATRYADELSGGERQKVFLARALAQQPEVLLLDEPTSALDMRNQVEVMELIRSVTRSNALATVMVVHDVSIALRYCDCFLLMSNGNVVAQGDIASLDEKSLSAAYGIQVRIAEFDGVRLVFSKPN
jgi:iron complex transport system ATP-binding protein